MINFYILYLTVKMGQCFFNVLSCLQAQNISLPLPSLFFLLPLSSFTSSFSLMFTPPACSKSLSWLRGSLEKQIVSDTRSQVVGLTQAAIVKETRKQWHAHTATKFPSDN